jgi:hypothetical protein
MNDKESATRPPAPIIGQKTLARVALEVFSIVLGVLLALAVSEWQESRQIQERTQAALGNVRTELAHNLKLLEVVHDNNADLTKHLAADPSALDEDAKFLPALQISDAAWETLRTTGLAGYVNLDLMVKLSETYSLIDVYRRSGYGLLDANLQVIATATATERDMEAIDSANLFARNFVNHFQLIVSVEAALIDSHRSVLELLRPD